MAMITQFESFDTGIPANFADINCFPSTGRKPDLVYQPSVGAVDLLQPYSNHGQWRLNMPPSTANSAGLFDFTVIADIEILASITGETHTGFHMRSGNGEEQWQFSHYHYTTGGYVDGVNYGKPNGVWLDGGRPVINYTLRTIAVGGRYQFKIERVVGSKDINFYIDDLLVFTYQEIPASTRLIPSLFLYNTNIRVHSVSISSSYEEPIPIGVAFSSHQWANIETKAQAWPGESGCKQIASQTAEKAYGVTTVSMLNAPPLRKDFGFIEGVITCKTAPAVGQHVICLNDRFNLIAETLSGSGGYYRFDNLPINGFYAIHAYDNNEYKYAPVGADRRTPEAYS